MAFSVEERFYLPPPIAPGSVVWTRGATAATGTETLATVTTFVKDGWPGEYWIYYPTPITPTVRITDVAAAAGCRVEDLLPG